MKMESTGKYISRKLSDAGSALYRNIVFPFAKIGIERKCDSIIGKKVYLNKGTTLEGKDYCKYVFKSGSTLDNVAARESSRGKRKHGGLVEECVGVDDQILREVIIPTMAISRRPMDGSDAQKDETLNKS